MNETLKIINIQEFKREKDFRSFEEIKQLISEKWIVPINWIHVTLGFYDYWDGKCSPMLEPCLTKNNDCFFAFQINVSKKRKLRSDTVKYYSKEICELIFDRFKLELTVVHLDAGFDCMVLDNLPAKE